MNPWNQPFSLWCQVSNHRRLDCLRNRSSTWRSKETSKLCVTGLCEVNSPHNRPVTRKMFPFDDVIIHAEQLMPDYWNTAPYGCVNIAPYIHLHDNVIKWNHFPRHWPFVRGIHRSPVDSPHKGQWRGALTFSLIFAWTNHWANNRDAGDLRRYRVHYDITVMWIQLKQIAPKMNPLDLGQCINDWLADWLNSSRFLRRIRQGRPAQMH